MSLRKPCSYAHLQMPSSQDSLLSCDMTHTFTQALNSKDVNLAYEIFLKELNSKLDQIAILQGEQPDRKNSVRGSIKFQDQRRHPAAINAHASTLQTRRIFKACNQATEVALANPGYRRDRTWNLIPANLTDLPEPYKSEVSSLLQRPASADTAKQVVDLLNKALELLFRNDNYQRIKKWKVKMRSHIAQPYFWLKNKSKTKTVSFHFRHTSPNSEHPRKT